MEVRLYNTLSREVEPIVPSSQGQSLTFYTCGPTVYDYAHIGNFRAFLNADMLRRTLEASGQGVRQVMNITDVGHMTQDSIADGGGQDKMQIAADRLREAKEAGTLPKGTDIDPSDPMAVAEYYAQAFLEDAAALGIRVVADAQSEPELMPRPTAYMPQMIATVERLVESEHAYVAEDGVVYFDVQSFPEYGALSGNALEDLRSGEGGRVDAATQAIKRHPADFMLWKPDPEHVMRWQSPWGEGYPGWHLECSVMANALLGDEVDIHSGGEDNIFPHHECEIAQSRSATGAASFARYWFHTRFLFVDGKKMSKSAGSVHTLRDLCDRGASPAAVRLELIRTHYRSNANFTFQGLRDAQRQVARWHRLRQWLVENGDASIDGPGPLQQARESFMAAMCDDLNVSGALGVFSEAVSAWPVDAAPTSGSGPGTLAGELEALLEMDAVLGVLDLRCEGGEGDIDQNHVAALIEARNTARGAEDFGEADRIRDELLGMGVAIKDGPDGTSWTRVVQ